MEASPQGVGVSDVNLDGTDACIERERQVSQRGLTLELISPNTCRNTEVQIPQSSLHGLFFLILLSQTIFHLTKPITLI